jgi:ketosteroid isomerase-like protein
MSQENIEIVRRIYAAWTGDDVPGPVELLDRDIEYVNPEGAIEAGTRRGLEAFTEATQKVLEAWEYWRAEPESLTAVGPQVVAVVRYTARGRGSGMEVEGRESALWTLRDGKVIRYQWFHGADDAAKAAIPPR